jgi:hypothetical protein
VIPFWNVQVMLFNIGYLKEKSIKRKIPRYSGIGRDIGYEVVQSVDYYGSFGRIEGSGLLGFLSNFQAILNEKYTFEHAV